MAWTRAASTMGVLRSFVYSIFILFSYDLQLKQVGKRRLDLNLKRRLQESIFIKIVESHKSNYFKHRINREYDSTRSISS